MSKLWYNKAAKNWNEALPIGNGRLGGMLHGDVFCDKIQLNEDTLWSGYPNKDSHKYNPDDLKYVREALKNGDYVAADEGVRKMMQNKRSEYYLSLGSLTFETLCPDPVDYIRELDLSTGIYKNTYILNYGEPFYITKEAFCSFADDVMVYRFSCNWDWNTVNIKFNQMLKGEKTIEGDTITVKGRSPTNITNGDVFYESDKESIEYCAKVKVITPATVNSHGEFLHIGRLGEMTVIVSIGTSFNGYDKMPKSEGKDAEAECNRRLENALRYSYEELKARHIEAYKKEYDTTSVTFMGDSELELLPTDERISALGNGKSDPVLVKTLYDLGRYMLLCSSRKGTQAANLQGIWSNDIIAPWNSNYTTNINVQMNYWAAEQTGLSDCHMPLMDMLSDWSHKENHLGMRGWYCAHNSDIWRFNLEATNAPHGFWQMGGIWTCRHVYEHYMYTQDKKFLEEYMPILIAAEEFLSDLMVYDSDGYLTTSPSESPENGFMYNGKYCQITTGTGMDISLICDFYMNLIELCGYLGKDASEYEKKLAKIRPLKIGSDGRLLEWDAELEENELGHRHISHLCGYFPCRMYGEDSPYFDAMKKSLEYRLANGGGGTGWSNAWITNMYTRMREPEIAYSYIVNMFKRSMYINMFDAHPPFQIDGNFGVCCAISEMLVQSHRGVIELLPCLPHELSTGSARNIRARGGYGIDMSWENGKITALAIYDVDGKECSERLIAEGKVVI